MTLSQNGLEVILELSEYDLNEIKNRTLLAVSRETTFISMLNSAIRDLRGNSVVAIPSIDAQQTSSFTPDTTSPILRNFTLNLQLEILELYYSETVNASSLEVSMIRHLVYVAALF